MPSAAGSQAANTDTIAAIATSPGAGGIGVVRVSGPQARAIATALTGKKLRQRIVYLCTLRDGAGATLDRGIALFFRAPRSYTGEDVLELQAHGSRIVLDAIVRRVCELGARPARAGEFSERAYLNGKLDLTQAEAVADLIAAGSEAAARAAIRSLQGEFSQQVRALFEALVRLRAWLEATLDFPEEDLAHGEQDFLRAAPLVEGLASLRRQLDALLAATRRGVLLRDGLHVTIIGRPNTGKSSLLNALARSERAIVTEIAGTTRDVLRESVNLDGIALTLVDTAGLRESSDIVEAEGMRRARAELAQADVAILVTDSTSAETDRRLLDGCAAAATRIVVCNKIDVNGEAARRSADETTGEVSIWLSAKSGAGLDLLRAELARLAGHDDGAQGAFSARTRHVQALQNVTTHLSTAHAQLEIRAGELAAEELRHAQQSLGEVTGEYSSDDLLGAIFSTFCIGK